MTLPLMNERDEARLWPVAGAGIASGFGTVMFSCSCTPWLIFKLKTWTVPLSLDTASHFAVEENARLWMSARSAPLRTLNKTILSECQMEKDFGSDLNMTRERDTNQNMHRKIIGKKIGQTGKIQIHMSAHALMYRKGMEGGREKGKSIISPIPGI